MEKERRRTGLRRKADFRHRKHMGYLAMMVIIILFVFGLTETHHARRLTILENKLEFTDRILCYADGIPDHLKKTICKEDK